MPNNIATTPVHNRIMKEYKLAVKGAIKYRMYPVLNPEILNGLASNG
jgi:hypothetical protein